MITGCAKIFEGFEDKILKIGHIEYIYIHHIMACIRGISEIAASNRGFSEPGN